MFREYGELKYRPSTILKKMVRAGQLGVKTGEGFFKYDKDGDRTVNSSSNQLPGVLRSNTSCII
jgi:3-hydroxyacyl-CoA dehydrogenase